MINIPNINLNNTRTKILIGIICIYLFIMNYLSIQLLLSILLLFFIVINYSDFNEKIVNQVFTKKKRNDLNYNHKIELSLNRLRKYKKYNLTSYNSGKEYWRKYIKYLKKLENDNLINYNHSFDKAHYYFNESIKMFNYITISFKDKRLTDIEYSNDYHNLEDLNSIIRNLHNEGYQILHTLSNKLNETWKNDPHVANKEIILESPTPVLSSMFNNNKLYNL